MYSKEELKSQNVRDLVGYFKIKHDSVFDKRDIYHLHYFLSGFLMAKTQLQKSDKSDEYFQMYFSTWLSKKFENKIQHTTSWVKIIDKLFLDEEKMDKFFTFFDDFMNELDNKPDSADLQSVP